VNQPDTYAILHVAFSGAYSVRRGRKNIDSSSKSNPLRRCRKDMTRRREDGGVVVEKKYKKT